MIKQLITYTLVLILGTGVFSCCTTSTNSNPDYFGTWIASDNTTLNLSQSSYVCTGAHCGDVSDRKKVGYRTRATYGKDSTSYQMEVNNDKIYFMMDGELQHVWNYKVSKSHLTLSYPDGRFFNNFVKQDSLQYFIPSSECGHLPTVIVENKTSVELYISAKLAGNFIPHYGAPEGGCKGHTIKPLRSSDFTYCGEKLVFEYTYKPSEDSEMISKRLEISLEVDKTTIFVFNSSFELVKQ